ncbi:glycosyltransferase [Thalassotalea marina]|uniref:Glycosyl transferase family 1 domain-containing protein n=1 Tax=Thalassotalea marina TaxID=1673741 RepID=A0A919BNG0_9GAMM|nr:glycosyltransferase [Thalassotalea marina]GHF99321.1 hypothetical protein GCM10017161_29660 [Thalassotalea marina]
MAKVPQHILMIAFDFPPRGGSGVERTLKFARFLSTFGWKPVVLTVNESTHGDFVDHSNQLENDIIVERTFCLDASRHLAFRGRHFEFTKKPDRYWGWSFTAVPKAMSLIKQYDIKCLWSTYPVMTSHIIGYVLNKLTKLPWIADYRDPLQCYYDELVYHKSKAARFFDKLVVKNATKLVFVTNNALSLYADIYGERVLEKSAVIENGFDSKNLEALSRTLENDKFVLFHGGSLYETGRQPQVLFDALKLLKAKLGNDFDKVKLNLLGAHNQQFNKVRAEQYEISQAVEFKPQQPYQQCLQAMLNADVLVVIQGQVFDNQIPGKIYEYLNTDLPIVVITPNNSATDVLVKAYPGVLSSEEPTEIAVFLASAFTEKIRYVRDTKKLERRERTQELAQLLDSCV